MAKYGLVTFISPCKQCRLLAKLAMAVLAPSQCAGSKEGWFPLNTTFPKQRSVVRSPLGRGGGTDFAPFLLYKQ